MPGVAADSWVEAEWVMALATAVAIVGGKQINHQPLTLNQGRLTPTAPSDILRLDLQVKSS
jgi:hypothetical protein